MLEIVKRLRAVETSAALYSALREIEAALPGARAALAAAEQERAGLLLTGDDRSIVAAEAKIQSARIAVDRLAAASGEAARRAAEAEAREAREALDAERAAVEKRVAAVSKRLLPEYEKHGGALADLLREVADADAAAVAINHKLIEAQRGEDVLRSVEERAIAPNEHFTVRNVLRDNTSIVSVRSSAGWGCGADLPKNLGFKF